MTGRENEGTGRREGRKAGEKENTKERRKVRRGEKGAGDSTRRPLEEAAEEGSGSSTGVL